MGRPSKLTPAVTEKLVKALSAGSYFGPACQYAGISEATGHRWIARGKDALAVAGEIAEDGVDPHAYVEESELPYCEFCEAVEKANAEAEISAVADIRSAARAGTWTAAAWLLERRFSDRWRKRDRVEVERVGEDPDAERVMREIATEIAGMTDEEIAAEVARRGEA